MKSYKITVNGNVYDVVVEEVGTGAAAPVAQVAPVAPVAAPKKAAVAPAASGAEGKIKVSAPMPGKILSVKTSVGASVNKGDVLFVLEAMKMENEIVAPESGTVATVSCAVGDAVEPGSVLASLN